VAEAKPGTFLRFPNRSAMKYDNREIPKIKVTFFAFKRYLGANFK
jgi:hypothetical protein